TPVIAYRRGGATETVEPKVTGMFFEEQTVESLMDAVEDFEDVGEWDHVRIRQNAERFSVGRFRAEFEGLVKKQWAAFKLAREVKFTLHAPGAAAAAAAAAAPKQKKDWT